MVVIWVVKAVLWSESGKHKVEYDSLAPVAARSRPAAPPCMNAPPNAHIIKAFTGI